jgi:hypothetical protein
MLNIGSRLIPLDWNGQKVPFPRSMAKSGWIGGGRKLVVEALQIQAIREARLF